VRNEIIVTMDADCSINPSEIQLLLNELEKGYDFVVGSKYLGGAFYEKQKFSTKLRSFISESGNRYLSVVSGIPLRDFSLNFRAFTVKVAQSVKPDDYKNFFLVQQIIRANKKGFRITEVPVTFSERKFGSSKTQVWNQAIRFFIGGFEEVFLK